MYRFLLGYSSKNKREKNVEIKIWLIQFYKDFNIQEKNKACHYGIHKEIS